MQTYHQYIVKLERSIYMTYQNIKEKVKTVVSSVSHRLQIVLSYLISCYQTVRAFGVCLSQRFSKNVMIEPRCQICRSTSYNCGIVSVIILVCIALVF